MELRERDNLLLEFIEKFKIMDVPHAVKLVNEYTKRAARKRLKQMFDDGKLQRDRKYRGQNYTYFYKPVKQYEHRFLLMDFYCLLSTMCTILEFETEYKLKGEPGIRKKGDVIADAYMYIQRNDGKKAKFIIEVQQPFNPFNFEKYKGIDIPTIIAITDKKIEKQNDVIVIDTKFKNIKEVLC